MAVRSYCHSIFNLNKPKEKRYGRSCRISARYVCYILGACAAACSDYSCIDYEGGIQFTFVGIVIGGLFYGNIFQPGFSFETSMLHIFKDGLIGVLRNASNIGIIIFLVVLGIIVCMMNKAGGSAAFGQWASKHIKTRIGAQIATIFLGILILLMII